MRRFKMVGNAFPSYMKNKIFTVERVTDVDYYITSLNVSLNFIDEWEVVEVDIFNEYLKLIKQ